MEAFAALGVAVNLAQVVEYGFQLIRKGKDIYEKGVTDPALNDDAQRLNNLANDLISQGSSKCSGSLRNLVIECAEVSKTITSELEKLKPTDPQSKVQRAKAILKRERKKGTIVELERRLQDLKGQLSLHLTSISRIEFNDKLDQLNLDVRGVKNELAAMHLAVKELRNSDYIGQEISKTFQPLVQQYYDRFCQLIEQTILDMLHFPDMHERFDTIPDAHKETLGWLFDATDDDRSARSKAGKDFITWLRQGSGCFHISGKPGSGKSTMMKHICSHQALDNHLQVWCEGRQLGRGQFFSWKPGSSQQKSIKGLLRGLLHSILDTNRSLISTALPDVFVRSSSSRQLEYRDFQQGFENLLSFARDSGSYKFVLFIDGLDEFEGRHLDLITTMKEWTEKYPLKICVSSREYGVFLQSFSSYPKLRLHECNLVDIQKMVSARLKSNPFCADFFKSDETLRTIVDMIEEGAGGVFIWVSLVTAAVEDAVISGADLPELEERIYAYPKELDDLYWHLVHLIHETDRKWAFGALKMVQYAQHLPHSLPARKISLLQLSFLDETIQYETAAGFSKVSMPHSMIAEERLNKTYKKVYGRCKGFLHVVEDRRSPTPITMEQQVVFTHRSLVEFLETASFVELARRYAFDSDFFIIFCGTFLRCLECQQPIPDVFKHETLGKADFTGEIFVPFWEETFQALLVVACLLRPAMPDLVLHCLEAFQDHVLELSKRVEDRPSIVSRTIQQFALMGLRFGVTEPWTHLRDNFPSFRYDTSPELYNGVLSGFFFNILKVCDLNITQNQFIEVIHCFIRFGVSFEAECRLYGYPQPLWKGIIVDFLRDEFPQDWCPGTIFDWCLQHGADPDLTVGEIVPGGPHLLQWLEPPLQPNNCCHFLWIPREELSFERFTSHHAELLIISESSLLCQIILGSGGALKLQGLLSCWFPGDEYFPNLIDRLKSCRVGEHSDSTSSPTIAGGPPEKIVRRTLETDYIVYTTYSFLRDLEKNGIVASYLDGKLVLDTRLLES
ncbi:hypothetical protein F4680DRAFT_424828 [Xylaria scruposa]|nr:hypothetical protein F4680DRAFT_424828 [Xylaria scruposa]